MRLGLKLIVVVWTAAIAPCTAAAETRVVVTMKPIHALVASVMEGAGSPELLIKGQLSPHSFSLKPSETQSLHRAQIFFRVSEDVEPFTTKLIAALPEEVRVVTLAEAPGVVLLAKRTGGDFEVHEHHDGEHHDEDEHEAHKASGNEKHDHRDDHDEHAKRSGKGAKGAKDDHDEPLAVRADEGPYDGHIWLDPENAKAMTRHIATVLAEASPADAATFAANADRVVMEIDTLASSLARELDAVRDKPFVVFHDAYQYLEKRFGLAAAGSITTSPDVQPSAKRLSEIRAKLKRLNAQCVFAEPRSSAQLLAAVTEDTKARSGTLDPEGQLVKEGPGAYSDLMRALSAGLRSCLGAAT